MAEAGAQRRWAGILAGALCMLIGSGTGAMAESGKELIVLAAPQTDDPYYASVADDIFDFHVGFAEQIAGRDNVLILTDAAGYDRYVEALGEDRVAIAPMEDIWARDYGLANAEAPVMFRYTAAGQGEGAQGQADADLVQETLAEIIDEAGLSYRASDLLNDGGNFVEDGAGNAIASRKFLRDNGLGEDAGRAAIQALTGATNVAFIEADEQGGLEHADGVVAFLEPGLLVTNSYPEDPDYAADLRADLQAGLPDTQIHEIVTAYDGSAIYDERFGSACGLYTNMLVTPDRIYLPQFGVPEDAIAMEQVQSLTAKEVVPVRSEMVCHMGGGVRCMSWQVRGGNGPLLLAYIGIAD